VRRSRREAGACWDASGRTWYLSLVREGRTQINDLYAAITKVDHDPVRFVVRDFGPDARLLVGNTAWVVTSVRRKRQAGDWLPTIGVVPNGPQHAILRILAAGADDCVIAPKDARELKARLKALLRRAHPDARPGGGKIELNENRSLVRLGSVEARLTRKQFEIFSYLAARHDRWVHTSEIIQEVCRAHHAPDTSLVRVQVHAIRRALGSARDTLQSNGRRGYRLHLTQVGVGETGMIAG
jgi:DNA-binding response OmpR family regulator